MAERDDPRDSDRGQGDRGGPPLPALNAIKDVIDHEREPLTDAEIAEALGRRGIPVARRAVAKYREQLGILPSLLRRGVRRV